MVTAARYLNRELVLVLLAVTAVLLTVTVGGRFISYLQDAALGKYTAGSIATILWYRLPGFLQLLLPFGFYLALVLTLSRLHAEQEFEVLRGGGLGPGRLLGWLAPLMVLVALVVGYFSLVLAPDFDRRLTEFIREQRANAEFNVMSPGVFHSYQRGRRVTYADAVSSDNRTLSDVFMAELDPDADRVTIRAERGGQRTDPQSGARFLVLENGHRYQGLPGEPDYQIVSFGRLEQRLEEGVRRSDLDVEAESTATLLARGDPEAVAAIHFRLALPLLVCVASLMGIGVARTKPREGRFARVVPGLALFICYYAALVFNRNALADGVVPAVAGMWGVHGVFLVAGISLLRHSTLPARV
jgi:lipopolysaccharide export system permease protein